MLVEVYLPIPLKDSFTYRIKDGETTFGCRVSVPFGGRKLVGYVVEVCEDKQLDYEVKSILKVIDKTPVFTKELLDTAMWMSKVYISSPGQILSMMIPSGKRETESALFSEETDFTPIKKLSQEQQDALEEIVNNPGDTFYLYGVTGSGKSEVYLRAAEEVIKQKKGVIYLVPEITLTHQLMADISKRFSNRVALLHSALTPSQRLKHWHRIISGEADIAIGARSAVFAPFSNLGLIIIDEEHENSYKSGQTPRFHARQVAQKRAADFNATLIMGSATPSLEAYLSMKKGLMKRLDLRNKVAGGKDPKVMVVNMLKENRTISRELEEEIRSALSDKAGVILFLNRRGYTYYYHCNSCGHVIECPNCSIALTYHKNSESMVCHYCGYSEHLVATCPKCGSHDLAVKGFGTERVEEEAKKLFPSATIARLDTDIATADKEKVKQTIDQFKKGEIDILLGTQMVAKGLNFPRLRLVGVILADSTLSIPDFRAEERTFSLLEQVKGRAGRYRDDGRVVIQTYRIDNSAIKAVRDNKVNEFYEEELNVRKELNFPPYSRLVSLTLRSRNENSVKTAADNLYMLLEKAIEKSKYDDVSVIGLNPCIIYKKATNYRYQVLLSSANFIHLNTLITVTLEHYHTPSNVYIEIDVDPLSLL